LAPITGKSRLMSLKCSDCITAWRAYIQFELPRSVLISPLWQTNRKGCASGQVGNVFVENRW
jgi:hypothetical protein